MDSYQSCITINALICPTFVMCNTKSLVKRIRMRWLFSEYCKWGQITRFRNRNPSTSWRDSDSLDNCYTFSFQTSEIQSKDWQADMERLLLSWTNWPQAYMHVITHQSANNLQELLNAKAMSIPFILERKM